MLVRAFVHAVVVSPLALLACRLALELQRVHRLPCSPAYAVAIDMTARNVQDAAKASGLPWTIAKGFDTFCPLSQPIAKARLPDASSRRVELWLRVNNVERQRGSPA